jgi:hypothetical protein
MLRTLWSFNVDALTLNHGCILRPDTAGPHCGAYVSAAGSNNVAVMITTDWHQKLDKQVVYCYRVLHYSGTVVGEQNTLMKLCI